YTPAGVGKRISSGRIGLRYGVKGAMIGGELFVRQSAPSVGTKPQRCVRNEAAMKHIQRVVLGISLLVLLSAAGAQDTPEMPKVRLAVGGKSAIFYLPLSITERLGYFRDAGLAIEISDVQSGARALQSLVGGSAEVGVGTFDHTIQMQSKGQ